MVRYLSISYLYMSWCVGNPYTENALSTNQLDELVLDGADSIALSIGLEVTQVTDVTFLVGGGTVGLSEGVDYVLHQFVKPAFKRLKGIQ